MEWESFTEDQLDQMVVRAQAEIRRIRLLQMAAAAEKKRRLMHHLDGFRSTTDSRGDRKNVTPPF